MREVLKTALSLSVSGTLLMALLWLTGPLWKKHVSKRGQYGLWLIVLARLLLPLTPAVSLTGMLFQWAEPVPEPQAEAWTETREPSGGAAWTGAAEELPESPVDLWDGLCLVWLGGAAFLLIRKVTVYQSFVHYIQAGWEEVSDVELLDILAQIGEQAGVRRPVELCTNGLTASPLLLGVFRPCIVLPSKDLSASDFGYTVWHELSHYKQRDLLFKWLVQFAVCLHWFNPLVWRMAREISRACELACDERVIRNLDPTERRAYGDMLLRAAEAEGRYQSGPAAMALHESGEQLKERLEAIMNYKKGTKLTAVLSFALAAALMAGAAAAGAYPIHTQTPGKKTGNSGVVIVNSKKTNSASEQAEQYYQAGSLPLFQITFSRLSEKEQSAWLDRIYKDNRISFWGTAVSLLEDGPCIQRLAETAYKDGNITYFSTLARRMNEDTLEQWLDRAMKDGNWAFQSMLFNALDREDVFDELEAKKNKEWAEARAAEYKTAGVTVDGKNYYYKGQLVNVFLDMRANKSFYTLDMNPMGTVNVKILRNADDKITGAAYMTEAELAELFGDMEDGDDGEYIPVNLKSVKAGERVCLGEYTLSYGDEIWCDLNAGAGNGMKVYFAKNQQKQPVYWSVHNLRQGDESLRCTLEFTVEAPASPGVYKLYVQATDGPLGNVKGWLSVTEGE